MGTFDTTKGKDLDFYEQKNRIMAQEYFDMLADRILSQHCFYEEICILHNVWDDVIPYIYRLITHPRPALYISTIKNELRAKYKSNVRGRDRNDMIFDFPMHNLIAFKMYVVLRYRFAQDKQWMEQVLPSLYELADKLNCTNFFHNKQTLHTIFSSLLPYEEAGRVSKPTPEETPTEPEDKPAVQTEPTPALRVKDKHKTDIIKVLYAMVSLGWVERAGGEKATIEDTMSFFGKVLSDEGITNYSPSLGKAKNSTEQTFLKPFENMEKSMRKYYKDYNK